MKPKFKPESIQCYTWGGAAAGLLDPGHEAEAIGQKFHGAFLAAYMIRRFGPPNHPSDDHKNLCSWTITTPVPGLALLVTPYLGDQADRTYGEAWGMCHHFGYRHSPRLQQQLSRASQNKRAGKDFFRRLWKWQRRKFVCVRQDTAGTRRQVGESTLRNQDGQTLAMALCEALPKENRADSITLRDIRRYSWVRSMLAGPYREAHPFKAPKTPRNGRWPEPMLVRRCNLALRASIRALLQPIVVRDLTFGVSGLQDAVFNRSAEAEPFALAGWACRVDNGRSQ